MPKKIIIFLIILILFISKVYAEDTYREIKDYEIRYRFYKEINNNDSIYYPKGEKLNGYIEEENNLKYGEYSEYMNECEVSDELYDIEYKDIYVYKELKEFQSLVLNKFDGVIKSVMIMFYNKENLKKYNNITDFSYPAGTHQYFEEKLNVNDVFLHAYCGGINTFTITLYSDKNYQYPIAYKEVNNSMGHITFFDTPWQLVDKEFITKKYDSKQEEGFFREYVSKERMCRYRRIYTYRYSSKREYYDNDYHVNVDGYIKDTNDFKIYSKIDNKEIAKEKIIVKFSDNIKKEEILPDNNNSNIIEDKIKENYKLKEQENNITKNNNKKIYYILIIVTILIIFIIYKLIKKCRVK